MVERDDGVVYRLWGGPCRSALPHDVVHFVAEDALGITDGIWGSIAGGMVFRSMEHVSGRRPPHAAERSKALKREFQAPGLRAEMLAGLVEEIAALHSPTPQQIRRMAGVYLSNLPEPHVDPDALAAAAGAVRQAADAWAKLRVGEELSFEWSRSGRRAAPALSTSRRTGKIRDHRTPRARPNTPSRG
jgi:hypothetical protein